VVRQCEKEMHWFLCTVVFWPACAAVPAKGSPRSERLSNAALAENVAAQQGFFVDSSAHEIANKARDSVVTGAVPAEGARHALIRAVGRPGGQADRDFDVKAIKHQAAAEAGTDVGTAADPSRVQELSQELEKEVTQDVDKFAKSIPSHPLPRQSRVYATMGLCLLGFAFYFVHGGWWQMLVNPVASKDCDPGHERRLRLLLLFDLGARIMLLHPLVEYGLHRALHLFHVGGHLRHHTEVSHGLADVQTFEAWPYVVAALAYPCPWTRAATLGLLQYAWFHQLCHDMPWLMPETSALHMLHHHDVTANYGISLPGALHWPDRLLGNYHDSSVTWSKWLLGMEGMEG